MYIALYKAVAVLLVGSAESLLDVWAVVGVQAFPERGVWKTSIASAKLFKIISVFIFSLRLGFPGVTRTLKLAFFREH